MRDAATPRFRIGEVARRTGLTPAVLRAWETRYGLLAPVRSEGGTRLYSTADLDRIGAMQAHVAAGLAPAEAAAVALGGATAPDRDGRSSSSTRTEAPAVGDAAAADTELQSLGETLTRALTRLDRDRAETALDVLLGAFALQTLIDAVFLPYLRDVGERWAHGRTSIAEEHFASQVLRGRLGALSRSVSGAPAGEAILACPPGERHDLPLVMLAALLRQQNWSTTLLGADTPVASIAEAAETVDADVVILSSIEPEHFESQLDGLRSLRARWPLMLAGPGASPALAAAVGAQWLANLLGAARAVAQTPRGGQST